MNVLEYSTVMRQVTIANCYPAASILLRILAVPSSNPEAETDHLMTLFVVCRSSIR